MQILETKNRYTMQEHINYSLYWQSDGTLLQKKVMFPLLLLWTILAINTWRSYYPFSELAFFTILVTASIIRPGNLPYFAILPIFTPFTFPIFRPYVITFGLFAAVMVITGRLHYFARLVGNPLANSAVLFTLFYGLACLWSPDYHTALKSAGINLQALTFLMLLLVFLDRPEAIITSMKVIVCLTALTFFISLANFYWRDQMWATEYYKLITSSFDWDPVEKYSVMFGKTILGGRIIFAGVEPNYWGAQLQFPLWLAIGMMHAADHLKQKLYWLAASILVLLGIIGTYSRASFLTVLGVGILYALRQRIRGVLPLIVLVAVGLGVIMFNPDMVDRFTGIQEDITTRGGSGRLALWGKALDMWITSPVLGQGIFSYVNQYGAVHNTYLELLAEVGLVGLGLYLAVILIGVRSWHRSVGIALSSGNHKLACLAEGGFLGTIATYVNIASITAQDAKLVWLPAVVGFAFYIQIRKQVDKKHGVGIFPHIKLDQPAQ